MRMSMATGTRDTQYCSYRMIVATVLVADGEIYTIYYKQVTTPDRACIWY